MKKYMVGGAVRDKLMGLEPKDVDYVVVGSTPEEMLADGFQQVGADFPVFLDPNGVEYALARTERKSGHGYNGFVTDHSAGVTLEDDLLRRDLTINAMAMDGDTLIDPFNGRKDLENKVLRHVSPAFADDPVRVLRLARFHARFGPEWVVHPDTMLFACTMVLQGELAHLTRERVLKELEKALSEPHPELFFKTLDDVGALSAVLPECSFFARNEFLQEENASVKMRYAAMTQEMDRPEEFENRLNVSIEWRRYAKMWRILCKFDSEFHPVDILYAMDAYRQSELWEEMMQDLKQVDYGLDLYFVYDKTKHLSFSSLTATQQATLKGPEIAAAIRKLRIESV